MTEQEIFDKVVAHLLEQKNFSIILDSEAEQESGDNPLMCAYRGKDGLKCAIGALIPDDQYKPEMENMKVSRLIDYYCELPFSHIKSGILSDLQWVHDNEFIRTDEKKFDIEIIKRHLLSIGTKYNLVISESLNNSPIAIPAT